MEKVYRLMHNNLERGPFSIDELLQQNIQPWDLIWEEGKDKWQFASKIAELSRPHDSGNLNNEAFYEPSAFTPERRPSPSREPAQGADHFFTDKEEFELRAQELKKDVSTYTASYHALPMGGRLKTGTGTNHHAFDKIDLVMHKTERSKYNSQFLLACLVFLLFIYGWYKGAILNRDAQSEDIAAKPLIIPASTELSTETSLPDNTVALSFPAPLETEDAGSKPIRKGKATPKKPALTSVSKKQVVEEPQEPVPQTPVSSIETTEVEAPVQEPVELNEAPAAVERKKTFGQAIKGLFKKKNKKIDTAMGE